MISCAEPTVVELVGLCGYDFLYLDAEHSGLTTSHVQGVLLAADARGLPVIVNAADQTEPSIRLPQDLGAAGVTVPRFETVEQARELVRYGKYPPVGERGVGPRRASDYWLRFADYLERANADQMVFGKVESRAGLEAINEISAVEGLDGLWLGLFDLAATMGLMENPNDPTVYDAAHRIIAAAETNGLPVGAHAENVEGAARLMDSGARLLTFQSETSILSQGMVDSLRRVREKMG
jgi:2-keto-3-deoxy-L-rhamnonate aldolase RhmA